MFSGSNIAIHGGTFNNMNGTSRAMDVLMEWVATDAFHNSRELYDAPKCHPHTRVAVLDDIMQWVNESQSAREDFMMWLFGPAGAGKSAIAKRIAEIAAERDLLIADFFFSKSSPTRKTADRLIATLAYQLALSIPDTRSYIEDAIRRDQAIFNKNIQTQIDSLLITPLQSISSTQIVHSQKLIIIDGLDECSNSHGQIAILEAISRSVTQHKLPIIFLVTSRPEPDLVTSFHFNEPLRSIHRRLALDSTYRPDDDIRLFFSDKFEHIKRTHLLRSTIPITWPTEEILYTLVQKSSGQFIYASTVVKFVESSSHQPPARLNIILGILPPGKMNPFAELDALYNHILSSVDDIQATLRVLGFYVMTPQFASMLHNSTLSMSPELFLSLEPGGIQLALINLSSIVTYDESHGRIKIFHASFVDFLSDQRRSTTFYINKASTCTDTVIRRILQCVKGPDGIRAGDIHLFRTVHHNEVWIPGGQLDSEILNFDLDAFIDASIGCYYKEHHSSVPGSTIEAFWIWKRFLQLGGLEDRGKKEALNRLNKSFESRLQIYQSDGRLRLLLTIAVTRLWHRGLRTIPFCRYVDILLEMNDHDLHLVDQRALDLRHTYTEHWLDIISRVHGGAYASAALHCMRFLSNPPKYSERNERPEMGLTYGEWKATCSITLDILPEVLRRANTFPELIQFIRKHDIHPAVQKKFSADRVWQLNKVILMVLSKAKIRTVIERSRNITLQLSGDGTSDEEGCDEDGELTTNPHYTRQNVDLCCSNIHRYNPLHNVDSARQQKTPNLSKKIHPVNYKPTRVQIYEYTKKKPT